MLKKFQFSMLQYLTPDVATVIFLCWTSDGDFVSGLGSSKLKIEMLLDDV
jgi:hypothetical protein